MNSECSAVNIQAYDATRQWVPGLNLYILRLDSHTFYSVSIDSYKKTKIVKMCRYFVISTMKLLNYSYLDKFGSLTLVLVGTLAK